MGKRYTEQEQRHIQELASQGQTDESIAQQLGRSTNAIRNYRHRTNIHSKETTSIQLLKREKQKLIRQTQETEQQMRQLETRRDQVNQALAIEETLLNERLETTLIRLKDQNPELFTVTIQDQVNKLTVEIASSVIRWLIE